jgi:hypothetical protein
MPADRTTPEDPAYDPQELYGIVSADVRRPYDVREVIARVVDGSRFDEFKARYGTTIVTGFARLDGFLVGIVANNGVLFSESALKATHFIELCSFRSVPLIFVQNVTGFMVGPAGGTRRHREGRGEDGERRGELGRAEVHGRHRRFVRRRELRHERARVRSALSLDVAQRAHLGDGRRNGGLCAEHREARADGARGKTLDAAGEHAIKQPIIDKYESEGSPYYSTARLWDDGIAGSRRDPRDARARLVDCVQRTDSTAEVRRFQDVNERAFDHPGGAACERGLRHAESSRGAQRLQRASHRRDDGLG